MGLIERAERAAGFARSDLSVFLGPKHLQDPRSDRRYDTCYRTWTIARSLYDGVTEASDFGLF